MDAAFETLRTDGFRGATARAIAGQAGCNQAAIYYHFQGITPLLVEALRTSSARRLERYREVIGDEDDHAVLVTKLDELHTEDRDCGHLTVMTELVGGITAEPELRDQLSLSIEPWLEYVAEVVRRALAGQAWGALVPASDVADMIFSLVLGMELQSKLDGDTERFSKVLNVARLAASVIAQDKGPA